MGFWVFVALVLAGSRAAARISLERAIRELRGEIVTLAGTRCQR